MKLPRDAFDVKSVRNVLLAGLSIWAITSILYSILSLLIVPLQPHSGLIVFLRNHRSGASPSCNHISVRL